MKVSICLRRCLELLPSLSNIALYENTKLRLALKSLVEEFKVTQTQEVLKNRDPRDPKGDPGRSAGEDYKKMKCPNCCAGHLSPICTRKILTACWPRVERLGTGIKT